MRGDQRPPAFVAGEAETQVRFIEYLGESLARKLEGLSEEQVRRRLVLSGTSLLWLVKHVAAAQALWLQHFFLGAVEYSELPDEDQLDDETIATVVALLAAAGQRTREIVEAHDLDQLSAVDVRFHGQVSLRWILAHLVEEISRHAGHCDILRELIDGRTGR